MLNALAHTTERRFDDQNPSMLSSQWRRRRPRMSSVSPNTRDSLATEGESPSKPKYLAFLAEGAADERAHQPCCMKTTPDTASGSAAATSRMGTQGA